PDEAPGDLAVDDLAEQGAHVLMVARGLATATPGAYPRGESAYAPRCGGQAMRLITRRFPAAALAVAVVGGALAACAQDPPNAADDAAEDDGGPVELRFAWWGADLRNEISQEAVEALESEHPDITANPESADLSAYQDRLPTHGAANDLTDVIQIDEKNLRTYAAQRSLMDLYNLEGLSTD